MVHRWSNSIVWVRTLSSMTRRVYVVGVVVLVLAYLIFRPHLQLVYVSYLTYCDNCQERTITSYMNRDSSNIGQPQRQLTHIFTSVHKTLVKSTSTQGRILRVLIVAPNTALCGVGDSLTPRRNTLHGLVCASTVIRESVISLVPRLSIRLCLDEPPDFHGSCHSANGYKDPSSIRPAKC
jgi:hypothetical protein